MFTEVRIDDLSRMLCRLPQVPGSERACPFVLSTHDPVIALRRRSAAA